MGSRSNRLSARAAAVSRVLALGLALGAGLACGGPAPSDPVRVRADARALQVVLANDRTVAILEEVDRAVDDRLPVRAAELIDRAALPAARTLRERLEQATIVTPEGERVRTKAVGVASRRVRSLEQWRDALARGTVEDMQLVDAMRSQRAVERELVALDDELAKLRPLGPSSAPGAR